MDLPCCPLEYGQVLKFTYPIMVTSSAQSSPHVFCNHQRRQSDQKVLTPQMRVRASQDLLSITAIDTMSLNTANKPIITVVGAGPGIGEAVARRFASEGFIVALLARTEDKLKTMVAGIDDDFGKGSAYYYTTDLRVEDSVLSSFANIRKELGPVQVLVYNAGARRVNGRSILDTTTEEFENFTKINLFGAFWSSKCVLPDMLAAGKGTILFTSATGALRGMPGLSSFSPGKFGLRSLCQVITREYQSQGIHAANIIVDGPVDGKLIGGVSRRQWQRGGEEEKLQDIESYLMQPSDLAHTYWFLHTQPRSTWTQELDVRAMKETMFSKL